MTDDQAYFDSEGFKEILKQYEESAQSGHPAYMDADDLADIADYYQLQGRIEDAETVINLALEYNPEAVGPLLYRGREALNQNDFDTAQAYSERIEAVDSREALYFKGEILICKEKVEEADELFRSNQQEIMPDEQMDYVYDVACLFSDYGVFDKAFEWIARSQGDDSDDFKELMARTLSGLGKYKDSERIFNELIDHNPFSVSYWNALANAQFMNEDYNAAITSSEYAIAIDPHDAESILSKAKGLYNLGNYESALSYFRRYSELMPNDDFCYLHQGTCLINLGRYQEAIDILGTAELKADEESKYLPEIYQEMAFAYSELKKIDEAIYYIDKMKELDYDQTNMSVIKGHILMANGKMDEAEEIFKQALQQTDNIPGTILKIIVSFHDNHYVHASYKLFKHFFGLVDENWNEGYSYMAVCCHDMNKKDEFLHYLKIAVERNPKEARTVLGIYFPEGMRPEEYYDYISKKMNVS